MLVLANGNCRQLADSAAQGILNAQLTPRLVFVPPVPGSLQLQQAMAQTPAYAVVVADSDSSIQALLGLLAPGTKVSVIQSGAGKTNESPAWRQKAASLGLQVQAAVHVTPTSGGLLGFLSKPKLSEGELARAMAAGERLACQSLGLSRIPRVQPKAKERIPNYRK
jgi:hypothetical protein